MAQKFQHKGAPLFRTLGILFVLSTKGTSIPSSNISNVEGMYATLDIKQGAVIFTEENMPHGELHRSSQANCNVCELEDAVISIRPIIKSGDVFVFLKMTMTIRFQ